MDKTDRDHELPDEVIQSFSEKRSIEQDAASLAQQAQFERLIAQPDSLLARVMRQKLEDARRQPSTNADDEFAKAMRRLEDITKLAATDAEAIEREYRNMSTPKPMPMPKK